ncbi:MAG TPA: hydrogenase maturation protease [Gemmataceae bacterium]|nr:hydrogenase maturation protease [Gemmataceae bacterium]
MSSPRILIAGVGNIFMGDDAFGVEVAQRLGQRPLPEEVRVIDFGIRGMDLTYALLDDYETVILVDALPRGGKPGTLYVLEPEIGASEATASTNVLVEAHDMDPAKVLCLAQALGSKVQRVLVVGCEPSKPATEDEMEMAMSPPVEAAADEAVVLIESIITRSLDGDMNRCGAINRSI